MDSMKGNARNRRNQTQEVDFGVLRAGERTGSWSVRGSELRAGETGRTFATSELGRWRQEDQWGSAFRECRGWSLEVSSHASPLGCACLCQKTMAWGPL